jgi:hypothetical protein
MNFEALKKIIYILLSFLIFMLYSCVRNDTIVFEQVVGRYQNSDSNAVDCHYLTIRPDSTYTYFFSPKWGDNHLYFRGKWEIEQNKLVLFEGVDFGGNLNIQEVEDYKSDTLRINFCVDLKKKFPNMKFYIDDDIEVKPFNNQLEIIKKDYWKHGNDIKNYKYVPCSLILRQGNFFAELPYAFENREINISLKNSKLKDSCAVLTKYFLKNSILNSVNESDYIERHKLKREIGTNH